MTRAVTIQVCRDPAKSLEVLRGICGWADELHLAYAWASSHQGHAAHWRCIPFEKVKRALIGIHFAQTEPAALEHFAKHAPDASKVVDDTQGVFHPKLIVGIQGDEAWALLGSSNLTVGGFKGNTELNVSLRGPLDDPSISEVLAFLDENWTHPRAFVPDADWLARYAAAHELASAQQPIRVPKPRKARPTRIGDLTQLDIEWDEFLELITSQERRALSNGTPIHVFDHEDGSYLQEIDAARAEFRLYPEFATMPVESRKLVAGTGGGTSGYFGRNTGAGNFKHLVISSPSELGKALDALPIEGDITKDIAGTFLERCTAIHGISIGVATRLAAVKRPDAFLTVNGASRDRLREVFGKAPTSAAAYANLLERIWQMPWYDAPCPSDKHGRRVWNARVALVDAIMYEIPN